MKRSILDKMVDLILGEPDYVQKMKSSGEITINKLDLNTPANKTDDVDLEILNTSKTVTLPEGTESKKIEKKLRKRILVFSKRRLIRETL